MKKIPILLLAMAIVFGLMGISCAKEESAAAPETKDAVSEEVKVNPVEEAALNYFADFPGNRMITTEDVMAKMDAGEDFLILDIRQPDVYGESHLKGSVNAPWGPAIADALAWLPDDKPVYVTCYTGQTAGQTVAALNVAGIEAQSIRYGFNLGISKTPGVEAYLTKEPVMAPEASGVKYDADIKGAVETYFKAIPDSGSNILPAARVKEMMDAEEIMTIVSIRQADAYAEGHIEGAINIPWGAGMQESFSTLPKDEKVVVYCYSGQTAGQAVGILRLLGYDAVSLKSGMGTPVTAPSGWANEGFPVVK